MKGTKISPLTVVPYPAVPLEDIYKPQRFSRGLGSNHTFDLVVIFVFVMYAVLGVVVAISELTRIEILSSQVLAAMFTSGLATFAAIYQLSKLRFSTVDVFSSEILARLRILAADNSVARIITDADPHHVDLRMKQVAAGRQLSENVLTPSREAQFENFFRRSSDLGALSSIVVDHVTDFYSFHMAARDALRDLTSTIDTFPSETEEIKERVIDVIFMIDLMAYSGMRALDELIERPSHRWHSRQIALSIATRANRHLAENMPSSDHRYPEVMRRNMKYAILVSELKAAVRQPLIGRGLIARGLIPRGREFF